MVKLPGAACFAVLAKRAGFDFSRERIRLTVEGCCGASRAWLDSSFAIGKDPNEKVPSENSKRASGFLLVDFGASELRQRCHPETSSPPFTEML